MGAVGQEIWRGFDKAVHLLQRITAVAQRTPGQCLLGIGLFSQQLRKEELYKEPRCEFGYLR